MVLARQRQDVGQICSEFLPARINIDTDTSIIIYTILYLSISNLSYSPTQSYSLHFLPNSDELQARPPSLWCPIFGLAASGDFEQRSPLGSGCPWLSHRIWCPSDVHPGPPWSTLVHPGPPWSTRAGFWLRLYHPLSKESHMTRTKTINIIQHLSFIYRH